VVSYCSGRLVAGVKLPVARIENAIGLMKEMNPLVSRCLAQRVHESGYWDRQSLTKTWTLEIRIAQA